MSLTIKEVEHIANLARLELSDAEKERFCQQLSEILEYAKRLQSLDTSSIEPTASVNSAYSYLRDDVVRSGLDMGAVLLNAPQTEDNQFLVPPVIE